MGEAITKERIKDLLRLQKKSSIKVSIYIPTQKSSNPASIDADRIRFKNAIQEVTLALEARNTDNEKVENIHNKLTEIYDDIEFWKHLNLGLGVFMSDESCLVIDMPIETTEMTHVGDEYILSPLIVSLGLQDCIYILSLNLSKPKIYKANLNYLKEVNIKDMPESFLDSLRIDEFEQEQQFHSVQSSNNSAMFHGHGARKDNNIKQVENYLRLIDDAILNSKDINKDTPLMIAGDAKTKSLFKSITNHKNLVKHNINGNYELKDLELEIELNDYFKLHTMNKIKEFVEEFNETDPAKRLKDPEYEKLKNLSSKGVVKLLGINIINKTNDTLQSAYNLGKSKLDFNINKTKLIQIENVIQSVFVKGGKVVGTLVNEGSKKRHTHAILRY